MKKLQITFFALFFALLNHSEFVSVAIVLLLGVLVACHAMSKSASLGAAVAYRLFLDPAFQVDRAWFDGVALAENAAFPEWMMKKAGRYICNTIKKSAEISPRTFDMHTGSSMRIRCITDFVLCRYGARARSASDEPVPIFPSE